MGYQTGAVGYHLTSACDCSVARESGITHGWIFVMLLATKTGSLRIAVYVIHGLGIEAVWCPWSSSERRRKGRTRLSLSGSHLLQLSPPFLLLDVEIDRLCSLTKFRQYNISEEWRHSSSSSGSPIKRTRTELLAHCTLTPSDADLFHAD
jgi:hypothetical protein